MRYLTATSLDTLLNEVESEMLEQLQRDYAVATDIKVGQRDEKLSQVATAIGKLKGTPQSGGGKSYRAECATRQTTMSSASFEHMAVVTASTKRTCRLWPVGSGAQPVPAARRACTPLDPIDSETRARLGLESPAIAPETYVDLGVDIVYGDILVVGSTEYPIKDC